MYYYTRSNKEEITPRNLILTLVKIWMEKQVYNGIDLSHEIVWYILKKFQSDVEIC